MELYDELKQKIDELEFVNFDFKKQKVCEEQMYVSSMFRKALVYSNKLYKLKKEEATELEQRLNTILREKIEQLAPNFDEVIINEILSCYGRGYIIYPLDVFVVDDAVFVKEGTYNDFGEISKVRTFMYDNNPTYFNVLGGYIFTVPKERLFPFDDNLFCMSNEEEMKISKFISDQVNELLYPLYNGKVTKPLYELNTSNSFYGYCGLVPNEVRGVSIYLNKNFMEIAKSILVEQEDCDIKLCVQDGDDITSYVIHQSFDNGKPVWTNVKQDVPTWKLSEEAIKKEKNQTGPKRVLEQ